MNNVYTIPKEHIWCLAPHGFGDQKFFKQLLLLALILCSRLEDVILEALRGQQVAQDHEGQEPVGGWGGVLLWQEQSFAPG